MQPLTHARIGYDSITKRATISASGALTGFPASAAANELTYAFWSAGLPATWNADLIEAETCNYFGVAAHTLWSNHAMVVMQAWIDGAWQTMPVLTTAGDLWRFDGDPYGERGGAPRSTGGTLRRGVGADGMPVKPFYDVPAGTDYLGEQDSRFGSYALTVEPAVMNLFPSNVRNGGDTTEDMTGFDVGSDASYSTSQAVSGAGSIWVDDGGASALLQTAPISASASTAYTVQCKILCTEVIGTIAVSIHGDVSGKIGTVEFDDVPPGAWNLVQHTETTGGGDSTIHVGILIDGGSIYVDEMQLETGSVAHSWADGSQPAGDLAYQPEILQQIVDDCTISFWARMQAATEGSDRALVSCGSSGGNQNRCRIQRSAAATSILVSTSDANANIDDFTVALAWDGLWHMVTVVLEPSGSQTKMVYVDGKLVNAKTTTYLPTWTDVDIFEVGHRAGGKHLGHASTGLIDDLLVLNRAATATEIKAWYDSGETADLATVGLPAHSDDRPIMTLVEEQTTNKYRLRFVGQTTPVVGVIYMGKALEMARPLYAGHSPINLARTTVVRPNISERGQWLGRSIIRSGAVGSWSWSNLTAAWIRRYLDPFLESARTLPFFVLWRPETFPGESAYCWTLQDPAPPVNSGPIDLMSFTLDAGGLGSE